MSKIKGAISTIDEEEEFLLDVQIAISWLMKDKGFSQKRLADLMGVSPSAVNQLFDEDGKNLTLRTVARVFAYLGENAEITSERLKELKRNATTSAIETRQKAEGKWIGVHLDHAKSASLWESSSDRRAANQNYLQPAA